MTDCPTGKVRYRTETNAVWVLLRGRWREHHAPVRVYYCRRCAGWHLTSGSRRKPRVVRR